MALSQNMLVLGFAIYFIIIIVMYGTKRFPPRKTIRKKRRYVMSKAIVSRPVLPLIRSTLRDMNVVDTGLGVSYAANVMTLTSLFQPIPGTAKDNRIGDKTLVHSLQYKFVVTNSAGTQASRILIIYDKQPNSALPTSPEPLVTASAFSFKDADLADRFIILRDFMFYGNATVVGSVSNQNSHDPIQTGYMKIGLPTYFTGNAGSIADIRTGSFILVGISANAFSLTGNCRFTFSS